ncbi:MAG: Gfo/Idh/MocA family oxidoreductase [Trueperaceae bacterium]
MNGETAAPLRLGMVGGGTDAFIGEVHRMAARVDGDWRLVAGALSSTPERSAASARALGLERGYGTWQQMLAGELALPPAQRVDAVSIVTPNHLHFPVAKAFVEAGFNVVCDKPLTLDSEQATELMLAVKRANVVFAVTYNYTGYPLIKEARALVRAGELGELRKVVAQYRQGWLATRAEDGGSKQAAWRLDPARSGAGGAIGDIGSHVENLVSYVTGLETAALAADLTPLVSGRSLDDDAGVLVRFAGGAKGVLVLSQVEVGEENGLTLSVYGSKGGLTWRQEEPNRLELTSLTGPRRVFTRAGGEYLSAAAQAASRLPSGHPEGFIEAFANIYRNVAADIRRRRGQRTWLDAAGLEPDYPTVVDGARGVAFIETAVASSASNEKWTAFRFRP